MAVSITWTGRGGDVTITEEPAKNHTAASYAAAVAETHDVPGNDFYLVEDHTDGKEVDPNTKIADLHGKHFTLTAGSAKLSGVDTAEPELANAVAVPSSPADVLAWVNAGETPQDVIERANEAVAAEHASGTPRFEVTDPLTEVLGGQPA